MSYVSRVEKNPFAQGLKPVKLTNRDLPRSGTADRYSPPAGRCEPSPPKKKSCSRTHTAKKKAKTAKKSSRRSTKRSRGSRTSSRASKHTARSTAKKTDRSSSRAYTQSRHARRSSSVSTGQRYTCRPSIPRRPEPCRERGYWEFIEIIEIEVVEVVEIVEHGGVACYPPFHPPVVSLCPPPVVYDPCPPFMVERCWSPPPMVVEFIPLPPPIVFCPPTIIIVEDGGFGCFPV